MPVFARDVLAVGPSGLSALMSAVGVGSLLGSFMLAALSNYRRKGLLMIGMGAASGLGMAMFALSQWFAVSFVALAAVGATHVMALAVGQTLLNLIAPNEYRGRVMSVWMMIWNLEPIVLVPAGWLTDQTGAPLTVLLSGLLVLGFFAIVGSRKGELRDYGDAARPIPIASRGQR